MTKRMLYPSANDLPGGKIEKVAAVSSSNGVRWPLSSKKEFPITSGFRTANRPKHDGVDMKAPLGTPIYAIYNGVVSSVSNNAKGSGGIYVLINHDLGAGKVHRYIRSYYLHLQKAAVSVGKSVKIGETIGYVNNTGSDSDGNHLHLGIQSKKTPFANGGGYYEGTFINPTGILP